MTTPNDCPPLTAEQRRELERLLAKHGDNPKRIVDAVAAAGPGSPLYNRFEWDDAKAAALFREEVTAERIASAPNTVRVVKVERPEGEPKTNTVRVVKVERPEGEPPPILPPRVWPQNTCSPELQHPDVVDLDDD